MNLREDEYEEIIPTDIMLKLMKTKDQEEILKVAGKWGHSGGRRHIINPHFLLKN